jgi:triacylglycerol esterase/lipase EstA (alpha/beta hydrolase family)
LSSGNHQVYYNDKNKKLLFNVAGTHNAADWLTEGYLAAGKLRQTARYKEADKMLKIARDRYKPSNVSVTGHSVGGSIARYISGKNDKVLTLDKGATIGQKVRNNENALRTSGDLVSLLNANSKHMTTLKNPNYSTGIMPIDILNSHSVDNIKNKKIFV